MDPHRLQEHLVRVGDDIHWRAFPLFRFPRPDAWKCLQGTEQCVVGLIPAAGANPLDTRLATLRVAAAGVFGQATAGQAAPRTIACWGDSLTAGAGSGNILTSSYPARLGVYADRTVYNGGREGERSGGIAARQQGVPARTAVERVTIPASGFVDVQFSDEVFFRTGPRSLVAGTLKGVAGEMARLGETGTPPTGSPGHHPEPQRTSPSIPRSTRPPARNTGARTSSSGPGTTTPKGRED
jgi:hypothetical protein